MIFYINGVPVTIDAKEYTAGDGIEIASDSISVKVPTKHLSRVDYEALTDEQKLEDVLYIVDDAPWVPASLSIQEYDTDDGWHVRKWSDGYVEMYYTWSVSVSFSGTSATIGYAASILSSLSLPVVLTKKFTENVSILNGNGPANTCYILTNGLTEIDGLKKTNAYAVGSSGNASTRLDLSMLVTGRWK